MIRRLTPWMILLTVAGCGGNGQQTTSVMSPSDPTMRSGGIGGGKPEAVFKPAAGLNSPLGVLKLISEKSPLAKPAEGKVDPDSTAKIGKLDKGELRLNDAYSYYVADSTAPRVTVGEKELSVPLPAESKVNPDGSVWVVDAETRRVFSLTGVKREADKPATVGDAANFDLVHPLPDAAVPGLGLVARADEATTEIKHALRILAKGVGSDGAVASGARIRLKKSVAEKGVPPLAKAVIHALKKYGAVVEIGDGAPALSAIADPRWTKDDTKAIAVLHLTDFELLLPVSKTGNPSKK